MTFSVAAKAKIRRGGEISTNLYDFRPKAIFTEILQLPILHYCKILPPVMIITVGDAQ